MSEYKIPEEAVRDAEKAWRRAYHAKPFTGDDHSWMRAALQAALPHLRVHETASKCLDCEHTHTPDGCTGQPTPGDMCAGVTPSICDCPSLRVQETPAVDLNRLIAIKWQDKVIDPAEVAFVLPEEPE